MSNMELRRMKAITRKFWDRYARPRTHTLHPSSQPLFYHSHTTYHNLKPSDAALHTNHNLHENPIRHTCLLPRLLPSLLIPSPRWLKSHHPTPKTLSASSSTCRMWRSQREGLIPSLTLLLLLCLLLLRRRPTTGSLQPSSIHLRSPPALALDAVIWEAWTSAAASASSRATAALSARGRTGPSTRSSAR